MEKAGQQVWAVLERARHDYAAEPSELVVGEVEVRRAVSAPEILRVRRRVQRAHRHNKAETISSGYFTAAPGLRQGDLALSLDQPGIWPAR